MPRPWVFLALCLASPHSVLLAEGPSGIPASQSASSRPNRPLIHYTNASGIDFRNDDCGLSLIEIKGVPVATGLLAPSDASYLMDATRSKSMDFGMFLASAGPIPSSTNRFRWEYRSDRAEAVVEAEFVEEDIRFKTRLSNSGTQPILATQLCEATFDFDQPPDGYMVSQDISWIQAHSDEFRPFHPSFENRLGGSYAIDSRFGVGISPRNSGLSYTGIFWWPDGKDKNKRRMTYVVPETIKPGAAATFEWQIRISPNRDWKHLLAPYKEHFLATFGDPKLGAVHYKSDYRYFAQAGMADNVSVTKDNPLGFHGDARRVDLPEGAKKFCDMILPGLRDGGGQGTIIWALDGFDPRGAMYRPDFDILPEPVQKNLPLIREEFKKAGMRLGLCARVGEVAFRADRDHDTTIRLNPADKQHLAMMWRRLKAMIDQDFTVFYLDSFGASMDDIRAMQFYRAKMGPDIQTFVEHPCDVMLAYSGSYMEITYDAKAKRYAIFWGLGRFWEIAQWLVPGVQAAGISRVDEKALPADAEKPFAFMFRNHISPMAQDWQVKAQATELKKLTDEFLDEKGQWRK